MPRIPIEKRLQALPTNRWVGLTEACAIMKSKSVSYVRIYLLAHPQIESKQVLVKHKGYGENLGNVGKWMFRRIEDVT